MTYFRLAIFDTPLTVSPPSNEFNATVPISQRNGSGRDSRSGGGDGINSSEHWKLVEQLRLAEKERSR